MRAPLHVMRRSGFSRMWEAFEAGGLLLWILVCVVALVFLIVTGISAYNKNRELDRTIAELDRQIQEMESLNAALRREKAALASDPVYVERILRRDLRMVRAGERVIREE